jgi:uncharacterized membrane protein
MCDEATAGIVCQICGKTKRPEEMQPAASVRGAVAEAIRKEHPDWSGTGETCYDCLDFYRARYAQDTLEEEKGEVTALEQEVMESLQTHAPIATDTNAEFDGQLTFGQRAADRMAEIAGSWGFITFFVVIIVTWITINSIALLTKPFDPFPYILLNLVLSCVAAIQAPVIMMSQNRQEGRDRLHAEQDYQVNLKAELEVQHLHEKMDHIMKHQWERLAEIQKIQVDLMSELVAHTRAGEGKQE